MKRKLMSLLLCAVMTTGLFATQTVWADEETETADEDIDFSEDPYEVNMVITLPAASPSQSEIDRVVEHVNEIKIKAYETFWLLKRKPIQLKVQLEED